VVINILRALGKLLAFDPLIARKWGAADLLSLSSLGPILRANGVSLARTLLSVVAALLLQLVIARYLRVGPANYLDLVLIVTVYSGFRRDPMMAMLIGAGSGLVQDSFSGALLGTQSLTKTLIGFFVGSLSVRVALDNLVPRILVLAGASVLNLLLFVGLHRMFGVILIAQPLGDHLATYLAWHVVANALTAIFIFLALNKFLSEETRRSGRQTSQSRVRR
jgi:rod shape-determining protein MreD